MLRVDGKAFRDRLLLRDPGGREVAEVKHKLVALRRTYEIEIGGRDAATVRKKLFTPFVDRYTVDIPGPDDLELVSDLFDHDFTRPPGESHGISRGPAWPARHRQPPSARTRHWVIGIR